MKNLNFVRINPSLFVWIVKTKGRRHNYIIKHNVPSAQLIFCVNWHKKGVLFSRLASDNSRDGNNFIKHDILYAMFNKHILKLIPPTSETKSNLLEPITTWLNVNYSEQQCHVFSENGCSDGNVSDRNSSYYSIFLSISISSYICTSNTENIAPYKIVNKGYLSLT